MLNPSDYDPRELRALAGAAAPTNAEPSEDRWATPTDFLGRAEARVRAAQIEDAFVLGTAVGGASRPYLASLPDSGIGTRLALDWLRYLVGVGGREGARDAFAFYRRVGWLGADAEEALAAYLEAFSDRENVEGRVRTSERSSGHRPRDRRVEPGHHRTSLLFVARLAVLR